MKPRSRKAKGGRFEAKVAKLLDAIPGWAARKQPGSGIYQSHPHDVYAVDPLGRSWVVECKKRKAPLATVERWLGQASILFVEADYGKPIVVMPAADFAELVGPLEDVTPPNRR